MVSLWGFVRLDLSRVTERIMTYYDPFTRLHMIQNLCRVTHESVSCHSRIHYQEAWEVGEDCLAKEMPCGRQPE